MGEPDRGSLPNMVRQEEEYINTAKKSFGRNKSIIYFGIFEFGLQAKPSNLYRHIDILATPRDDYWYRWNCNYNLI